MTWDEALVVMKDGKKITHRYFSRSEWMKWNDHFMCLEFEDGVNCSIAEFFQYRKDLGFEKDWSIKNV